MSAPEQSADLVDTIDARDVALPESNEATDSRATSPGKSGSLSIERGAIIGRYVVLSKLGAGAMGLVLAAFDPELDRKVAIKLLKPRGGDPAVARTRLQREAQALAKLDHPNVVGVYDVGAHGDRLFVAMEFVKGQTLGDWMKEATEPRPWREVVSVFLDAGRGLAAAHEAGLIHRDFKPDNVMLGRDGRVRVMDFGLARALDDPEVTDRSSLDELESSSRQEVLSGELTQTGAMMGTPAYMSFEQFMGRPASVRSDQFGFCVALYEALYGSRPFRGVGMWELAQAVRDEAIEPAPKGSSVPAWLRHVVVRGLRLDAKKRWPSMQALIDALADDPALRRRKWWSIAAVAGLLAGGWGLAGVLLADAKTCTGLDERLAGVWDDERRDAVQAAILATERSYAPATWDQVQQRLDEYTEGWVAARTDACVANQRGEQSDQLLDRRMVCLDERLDHVEATVEVLAEVDLETVEKAVDVASGLPDLGPCSSASALSLRFERPTDPEVGARLSALYVQLAQVDAQRRAGRMDSAQKLAEKALAEAEDLGWIPIAVHARINYADALRLNAEYDRAVEVYEKAYDGALGHGMPYEAAGAATRLMLMYGRELGQHDEGRRWEVHARPLARWTNDEDITASYLGARGLLEEASGEYERSLATLEESLALKRRIYGDRDLAITQTLGNIGIIAMQTGDFERARSSVETAQNIVEATLGPDHPNNAVHLVNLGTIARHEGHYDEARTAFERALAINESAFGPRHPRVANVLNNLGNLEQHEGNLDQARAHHRRALTIREAYFGTEHPEVGESASNLGLAAKALGDYQTALVHYERALAIKRKTLGPEHHSVAITLGNLGTLSQVMGDLPKARDYQEQSLAIKLETVGPEHPSVAFALANLGAVSQAAGDFEKAREYHEQALAIREKAYEPDNPWVAKSLTGLGDALVRLGETEPAIALLERALRIRSARSDDPVPLAETRIALARALWNASPEAGGDPKRARQLAEQARETFAEAGKRAATQLDEAERLLREH